MLHLSLGSKPRPEGKGNVATDCGERPSQHADLPEEGIEQQGHCGSGARVPELSNASAYVAAVTRSQSRLGIGGDGGAALGQSGCLQPGDQGPPVEEASLATSGPGVVQDQSHPVQSTPGVELNKADEGQNSASQAHPVINNDNKKDQPSWIYTIASNIHKMFGHSAKHALQFARKVYGADMFKAVQEMASRCKCALHAVKPKKSHAKTPMLEPGQVQVDIQNIRHIYLLVAVDWCTKFVSLELLPNMVKPTLVAGLKMIRSRYPELHQLQCDLQFQCLEGHDEFPELQCVPREAHGEQGLVERTIRELKTILLAEKIPRKGSALEKSAWLRTVEERLNMRPAMYYADQPITPTLLQYKLLPDEAVKAWQEYLQVKFIKLRGRDRGWSVQTPTVGQQVSVWKEPRFAGKRGRWHNGVVTQIDMSRHKCWVAMEGPSQTLHCLSWSKVRPRVGPHSEAPTQLPVPDQQGMTSNLPDHGATAIPSAQQDPGQVPVVSERVVDGPTGGQPNGSQAQHVRSHTRPKGMSLKDILSALQKAGKEPKVSSLVQEVKPGWAAIEIDTNAQVSVMSPEHNRSLLMETSKCTWVSDFSGRTHMKVLGAVSMPFMGVDVEVLILEGYTGPIILGQNFLSSPDVIIRCDKLTRRGWGSIPLQNFRATLQDCASGQAVKGVKWEDDQLPPAATLVMPAALHPSSIGITKRSLAAHSPLTYDQLVTEMKSPLLFEAWKLAFAKALEEWFQFECAKPADVPPPESTKLHLRFVIKRKEVDGVSVPHVRPVLNEYHGTGDLAEEELYTPGMLHDTWRILLCLFVGLLNKGYDISSVLLDFKRAFLKGDPEVAKEVWKKNLPFYVEVPAIWKTELHQQYLVILKGLEGLRSSPIIWRLTLQKFLCEACGLRVSSVDPCLLVAHWEGLPIFASLHGDDLHFLAPTAWLKQHIPIINAKYQLGKEQWQVPNEPVTFIGMEATLFQDNGEWRIKLRAGKNYIQTILDSIPEQITEASCPELRGKLSWFASICGPHLMVHSRVPDEVLAEEKPYKVAQLVRESPDLILSGFDLSQPVSLVIYVDSSMDSRQVTKVRGRSAALFVLHQHRPSLVGWYSRLQKRVCISSDVAECRAICEGIQSSLYIKELLLDMAAVTPWPLQLEAVIMTDSMGMVQFVHKQLARSRDLDYLLLKELADLVDIAHVPGHKNPADALTKLIHKAPGQYQLLYQLMRAS